MARTAPSVGHSADWDDRSYRALFDALTGLPKRALVRDRLDVALAHTKRSRRHVAVMFLEVASEARSDSNVVVRAVAARIQSALRPDDTVARVGDHEFVVVCSEVANPDDAETIKERLVAMINAPFDLEGKGGAVVSRIGVQVGRSGDHAEQLLVEAEAALRKATPSPGRTNVPA